MKKMGSKKPLKAIPRPRVIELNLLTYIYVYLSISVFSIRHTLRIIAYIAINYIDIFVYCTYILLTELLSRFHPHLNCSIHTSFNRIYLLYIYSPFHLTPIAIDQSQKASFVLFLRLLNSNIQIKNSYYSSILFFQNLIFPFPIIIVFHLYVVYDVLCSVSFVCCEKIIRKPMSPHAVLCLSISSLVS